ncbi:PAS domain-containing sensor histidine kinase [Nocardioides litoris]|uniref:PAS domain-containing sensor histidine kinase n=1 Tax=Nocardioides litoris TaxID=1926648 RepID=UPI0014773D81|nr:PAS domain-containing sensor histidine kinase [Nocardioides litoris]
MTDWGGTTEQADEACSAGAPAPSTGLLANVPDAHVAVDLDGAITEWNPAAAATFGWTRSEALGLDVGELLLNARRAANHRRQLDDFRATGTSTILGRHPDVPMSTRDGRLLRVDCVVWVVDDPDGPPALHTLMSDVTGRWAAVDDLRRATDDLSAFSAAMAHDLRVPLTTVRGWSELVRDQAAPGSPISGWTDRIDAAVDRGVALIDDLMGYLDVGRVLADRTPVDLAVVVRRAFATEVEARPRRAVLDLREVPVVRGDERLLTQLFANLLGNAFKYVPDDRTLELVVDAVVDSPRGTTTVRVADNGTPVAAADRGRIFAMFERGSGVPDATHGSGVGLAVARRIAELHDGSIALDPTAGDGNRFCVRLGT